MAEVSFPSYNPVPQGVSNSGEAFVLQGGDKPLQTIQRLDALNQRNAARVAAAKQKQDQDDLRNFVSGIKLDTNDFLPYSEELRARRDAVYPKAVQIYSDPNKSSIQKRAEAQQLTDTENAIIAKSNGVGKRVKELASAAGSDKRYAKGAMLPALYGALKDADGNKIPLDDLDPESLDKVLENPDYYDTREVVNQYVDDLFKKDSATVGTAAGPGRAGSRNTYESNLFVPNADKTGPMRDPITNQPILQVGPEAVAAADTDPFLKRILDKKQGEYTSLVESAMQKMQAGEQPTPAEREAADTEAAGGKPRAEFLKELVVPYAYQRTSAVKTNPMAVPRPRAASGGGAGVVVDSNPTFGVAGGQTTIKGGTGLMPSPAVFAAPMVQKKDGSRVAVVAKGLVLRNVSVQVPGQARQKFNNNTEAQDMQLGEARMVLVDKDGRIFSPTNPDVAASKEATERWMVEALRKPAAKQNGYRLTYAIESTPLKGENNLGSVEDIFNDLKASYSTPKAAPKKGGFVVSPMGGGGGGSSRAMPSDSELRDKARKLYAKQNGTYYPLYEGDAKRKIDASTPGYSAYAQQMQAEIQRLNSQVRQQASAPSTGGLYGKAKAAATTTTTKKAAANRGGAY